MLHPGCRLLPDSASLVCCRPLAQDQGADNRQAGLAGLVAFKHLLLPLMGHSPQVAVQIADTDEFWRMIRHSLVGCCPVAAGKMS